MTSPSVGSSSPRWFYRDLSLGDTGDDVLIVQRRLVAPLTGVFDDDTAARVRGVQKMARKKQTGVVDAATAEAIGEKATAGQMPEWFGTDRADQRVRDLLGLSMLEPLGEALLRYQSENGLDLSGELDEPTARLLADRSAD